MNLILTAAVTIPIAILFTYRIYQYVQSMRVFQKNPLTKNRSYTFSWPVFIVSQILLIVVIVFMSIALFRPEWGLSTTISSTRGSDVVFTLDVSQSMNALDTRDGFEEKDRLTMAKQMITAFVTDNPQHRYSLVIFAGEAFVSTPLTLDEQAFLTFLQGVDSNDVKDQGTDLQEALQASIERFRTQDEEERGKAIVIISDGGDEETGQFESFGTVAKQENIAVFTIGVGGFDGVPIPEDTDAFGRVEYKTYQGQTVLTELNEAPLKQIATDADGEYFHGRSADALSRIETNIAALQSSSLSEETGTRQEERYQMFTLVALICFIAGVMLPMDKRVFSLFKKLQ